ncbi:hypothetical protein V491_06896 [Pseudogymnoascus sp. VKM F-3775]|nr:hypothetical protein V491_06896 [Pseudogymnoascus sp. VKM F-3775]
MAPNIFQLLVAAPEVNPVNQKAKSIPVLNPIDPYGRTFFFSWLGFMVAFLSWYSFPPLLTVTIQEDLQLSQTDIANSNIIALLATLLIRLVSGPLCDRFGPRLVFVGILLVGSIPTAMAGLVTSAKGLIALRFFVGILGGCFVPCQVWTTGHFDKNVVGTANALAAGWGTAGAGVTNFVMPAVFDSLVRNSGLVPHKAWRVAYIVPVIIIIAVALAMLFLCQDTPTGKWSERSISGVQKRTGREIQPAETPNSISVLTEHIYIQGEKQGPLSSDVESQTGGQTYNLDLTQSEYIVAPTFKEILHIMSSPANLSLVGLYSCSFGAELSFNSILVSYYSRNFPNLDQTECGQWAAMFGLLNIVSRPLGGILSDAIYRQWQSTWAKKIWLLFLGVSAGAFSLAIGLSNPKTELTMFGLFAGMALFTQAANGATFSIVPHVYPSANGIVSGAVGAAGNFGGIIFSVIFRYNGTQYERSIWIIGVISGALGAEALGAGALGTGALGTGALGTETLGNGILGNKRLGYELEA